MKNTNKMKTNWIVYDVYNKGNKNLRIPVWVNHEFSQSMDFLEKARPYTFQMGSRLSLEIKN